MPKLDYDVLVFGDYFLDLIFTGLPQMPKLGQEIYATGFEMLPGGGYTVALALQRLGLKVGWAADFGKDDLSRLVVERARDAGLGDELFVWHNRPLRHITVAVSNPADRAFITYADPDPALPAAMRALATSSARVAYLTGVYRGALFDAGLILVRARRMKLAMDGTYGDDLVLTNPAVRRAVASVDLFMPNESEARFMTGQTDLLSALRELGAVCPLVVVKAGSRGAYAIAEGQIFHEPAISVTPVDTTGAGNCFNAGFLKAWLDERPLAECLRWGNIVGGLSTTARGGAARAVTPDDVALWLAAFE